MYFIYGEEQMRDKAMDIGLSNDRIGINTRVEVGYKLARIMLERGI